MGDLTNKEEAAELYELHNTGKTYAVRKQA